MSSSSISKNCTKVDRYAIELKIMQHKIDRLERALKHLAEKTGVSLEAFGV